MKTVSLKIDDFIFSETEEILLELKKSRNRYINEAISHYNRRQRRILLKHQLEVESELVKNDSMAVLREFEGIEHAD